MKCKCGNREFYAHQVCHMDVVVDGDNDWVKNSPSDDSCCYESNDPFGPYTCTKCGEEYDELSDKPVKFSCPKCNCKVLECVMEGGYSSIVTCINPDGVFDYDNEAIEAELGHYQCESCGFVLKYENGLIIECDEEIVIWIKENCPQN